MSCTPVKMQIGGDRSHLARRIPTPCKTGHEGVDKLKKEQHEDLLDCLDIIAEHPSLATSALRHLRAEVKSLQEKAQEGSLEVFENPGTNLVQVVKQNEVWCVSFLKRVFPKIPADHQAKAKDYDKDAVKQQFCFLLNATATYQLPKEWKFIAVAEGIMKTRIELAGKRDSIVNGALAKFIKPSGEITWQLDVYDVKFTAQGQAEKIVHKPTGAEAAVDGADGIDKTWGISGNWGDLQASLVKGRQAIPVHKFFCKTEGPHKVAMWAGKVKQSDAEAAAKLLSQLQGQTTVVDSTVQEETKKAMEAPQTLKRKEAAARARQKLEESQTALKRKRIVTMG